VAETLIANRDALEPRRREQIIEDIGRASRRTEPGWACDVERWTQVAEAMADPPAEREQHGTTHHVRLEPS
jgi:hypothetical protein